MEIEKSDLINGMEDAENLPITPVEGIAAIALNLAMKYHDMGMVKDGALYQQYKLEGRNIRTIGLADVFDTAIQIEQHLLGGGSRMAKIITGEILAGIEDGEAEAAPETDQR